jgi:DNA-damage-inducible protein D
VRGELTDEWKARGVAEGKEYSILTAEIARATFGVTPGEHSQLKGLDVVKTGNNLRDHMTYLELIFTMLGEASTTEIAPAATPWVLMRTALPPKRAGRLPATLAKRSRPRRVTRW